VGKGLIAGKGRAEQRGGSPEETLEKRNYEKILPASGTGGSVGRKNGKRSIKRIRERTYHQKKKSSADKRSLYLRRWDRRNRRLERKTMRTKRKELPLTAWKKKRILPKGCQKQRRHRNVMVAACVARPRVSKNPEPPQPSGGGA